MLLMTLMSLPNRWASLDLNCKRIRRRMAGSHILQGRIVYDV